MECFMSHTKYFLFSVCFYLVAAAATANTVVTNWKAEQFTLPDAVVGQAYSADLDSDFGPTVGGGYEYDVPDLPIFLTAGLGAVVTGTPSCSDKGFYVFLLVSENNGANTPTIGKFYLTVDGKSCR
jgi:hypothetical protein